MVSYDISIFTIFKTLPTAASERKMLAVTKSLNKALCWVCEHYRARVIWEQHCRVYLMLTLPTTQMWQIIFVALRVNPEIKHICTATKTVS